MSLITDDCDIRNVHFFMEHGGNGDYYITLIEYPMPDSPKINDKLKVINYRMAMSGGATSHHHEVRMAFAALYRAMESAGLNKHPKEDNTQ